MNYAVSTYWEGAMELNVTRTNDEGRTRDFMSTQYIFIVLIVLTGLMLFAAQLLAGAIA